MGDLSPHFSRSEFRCHCPRWHTTQPDPPKELIDVLEALRRRDGRSLPVLSGYRCSAHNRDVGGAPHSLHLGGRAADIQGGRFTVAEARAAGARGIGHCDGFVTHLDVRPGRVVTFKDCPSKG